MSIKLLQSDIFANPRNINDLKQLNAIKKLRSKLNRSYDLSNPLMVYDSENAFNFKSKPKII
jgi:hypothetical protein